MCIGAVEHRLRCPQLNFVLLDMIVFRFYREIAGDIIFIFSKFPFLGPGEAVKVGASQTCHENDYRKWGHVISLEAYFDADCIFCFENRRGQK